MTDYNIGDSLQNLVSGLGTTRDKATYSRFNRTVLDDDYLGVLYLNWIFAKAVDIPVDDMLSKWRGVRAPSFDDAAKLDEFYTAEIELNIKQVLSDTLKWSRLYGGAGILLDTNDPAPTMAEPLDIKQLQAGCINRLIPLDKTEITPVHENDAVTNTMRVPYKYQLNSGLDVHPSRFIRFDGIRLPQRELEKNNYWGRSVLNRIYDDALASKVTISSIASMIYESNIDVVSVKGLFQKFLTGVGRTKLIERFTLANLTKSINKTLILDADQEEFRREPLNFSGLPPMIQEFLNVVAAGADIPITRFLGQSAGGLNATGEGDLRNYYDMISARQESDLAPQLRQLDEVLTRHVFGAKPDDWGFEFCPLWAIPDTERATIDKTDSETDEKYINLGIIQPHHVAARLLASGRYDALDAEYVEDLKEIDEISFDADMESAKNPPEEMPDGEDQTNRGETNNDIGLLQSTETDSDDDPKIN